MELKYLIIFFWFLFTIWIYIFFVYSFGFVWFFTRKFKKVKYDKKLLYFHYILFSFSTLFQIFFLILWFLKTKDEISGYDIWPWIFLIVLNVIVMIYLIFLIYFTFENIGIKFQDEHLCFLGISILYSSIVHVKKDSNNNIVIEYVYKKDKKVKWTEKIKLIKYMIVTDFFEKNYKNFIDPQKNLDFFDIDTVYKKVNNQKKNNEK